MATTPPLSADLELTSRSIDILQVRQQGARPQEVLVLWEGSDKSEATWENALKFFKAYPNTHLEDKVLKLARGIVIPTEERAPPILKTYYRRGKRNG